MLIFGFQRRLFTLTTLTAFCGACKYTCPHGLRKFVTKFTLLFVPLFPINTERYLECERCGVRSHLPARDIPKLVEQGSAPLGSVPPSEMVRTQPRVAGIAWPDLP
ncbi:hypothetical protein [Nocardia jejuensis]|uniref:hypothetical protein n=1 Tax=Nocardia jejuensis TaxID=328049 RepID=UPI000836159D|nr:hypothetical protein [Nocardia jejuensis]